MYSSIGKEEKLLPPMDTKPSGRMTSRNFTASSSTRSKQLLAIRFTPSGIETVSPGVPI